MVSGDAAGVAELAKPWSWVEGAHVACAYRLCSFYFCFWVGSQQLVSIPIWMCLSQSQALYLCNTVTLRYSGTLLLTMAEMHSWRLERGCFSVQGHMFEWFQLGNPLSLVVWWSWGLLTFIELCHPLQHDRLPRHTHSPSHCIPPWPGASPLLLLGLGRQSSLETMMAERREETKLPKNDSRLYSGSSGCLEGSNTIFWKTVCYILNSK